MSNGVGDPWPLIEPQQHNRCYQHFNVGRPSQITAAKGAFSTAQKAAKVLTNTTNNAASLNRSRPCTQVRQRPWSPQGIDYCQRTLQMVRVEYLKCKT